MDQLVLTLIGTAVRWLLTIVATWLVSAGILQAGTQAEWMAGVAVGLVALIWGLYQKYISNRLLKAALNLPAGATVAEAQAVVSTPNG